MITIRSPLTKTLLLLTLTTLTIGLGASLSWENPSGDDEEFDSTIDLNISGASDGDSIIFERSVEGEDSYTEIETVTANSNGEASGSFSIGDLAETYTFRANNTANSEIESVTNILMDGQAPSVEFPDGIGYLGSDPTVTVTVEDSDTGVDSVDASVTNSAEIDDVDDGNCDGDSSCEVDIDIDTGDLDEGDEFDLDVTPTDSVGNSEERSETNIVFDSEWDGDSSADVEWVESGSDVLTGFEDEDQDVDISFQPDTVSDTSLTCEADGDEVDDADIGASDEDETANCEFESDEYSSSVFDLTVEAEDEAGNSQTLVDGKEMVWDTEAPNVDNLEQPEGVSTFNGEFDLNVLLSDDASGIETLEYYFDAGTDLGDGTSVDLEDSGSTTIEKTFSVDPGDLGQGSHTVYIRAEDGTGQTVVDSFDFEYFPDRNPSVNLGAPDSLEVTSGESKDFTLTIENGAPFFLNGVEVTGSGALWDGTVTATSLEEGDSVEKTITIDASSLEVGEYELTLETSDTGDSATVNVVVRATETQKESIDSELQEWQDKRTQLEENISRIGTLEASNENITQFTQKLDEAQADIDNGNYYQAKAQLEDINSSFSQASETFKEKEQEHKKNKRNQLFMMLFGGVFLIGGGIVGFLFYRDEGLDFDLDNLEVPDELPEFGELGVMEKVRELLDDAEEEIEEETGYEFKGFD